jgi:hypothetical protein
MFGDTACSPGTLLFIFRRLTMSWALIRTQYPARRRRASALPTSWSCRPRSAPLDEPPVGFVSRLLGGVRLDSDEKPPPVIRIAHLPNAFSISLRSASARVMRWADAHASIDFTNSTGIRVQMIGSMSAASGRLAFCLGLTSPGRTLAMLDPLVTCEPQCTIPYA